MKLWKMLKAKMLEHPDQRICEEDKYQTFREMAADAECFSENLVGIRCCAILCESEMMAAKALLACFAAEVTAVPLSMRYGRIHCKKILDAISPDAIIRDDGGSLAVEHLVNPAYTVPAHPPALIMCTSGTTGTPKGAMLSDHNLLTNVSDIAEYFAIGPDDTILISRPLYHCAVLAGEFLTALWKGTNIRFLSTAFNPPALPALIRQYGITAFCGTPTLVGLMCRFIRKGESLPLKHVCISGECMDRDTGLRIADALPDTEIYHIYGLTEASPRVAYLPPAYFREYPDCVGVPLKSVEIKVVRAYGDRARENEDGILYVKGENVMLGYYNNPEKTNAILSDGWLCTGDTASINEKGFLKIKGRSDDMIIKAGMNIYPQEIESALKTDPRVREVLAYGYLSIAGTQIGLNMAGDFCSEEEVMSLCREVLPQYQLPQRINLFPELEKNGSGKIKRIKGQVNGRQDISENEALEESL